MTSNQIRGNCQCCGRQQAVVGRLMSKHGYTVDNGWFSGVCSGRNYVPLQESRTHTDVIVAQVRDDIPKLIADAEGVKAGVITPKTIKLRIGFEIPFAEGSERQQMTACNSLEWSLRSRARSGEQFADSMEALATKLHGTALIEVAKKEAPEYISVGDQKSDNGTIYTCTSVVGARVYHKAQKGDKTFKGWTGCQAWRKMEAV